MSEKKEKKKEDETVSINCYMVVTRNLPNYGYRKETFSTRVAKNKPGVKSNEVAIRIELSLPRALFTRPSLTAKIRIDPSEMPSAEINAETVSVLENLIRKEGYEVRVIMPEDGDDR